MTIEDLIKKERFFHHFQPIYKLSDMTILGYEVLLRSNDSSPEQTFRRARKEKQLYELDSRSIHKAVLGYLSAGMPKKDALLFLNVFPSTILNPGFPSFLKQIICENHIHSQQKSLVEGKIVLEISEDEVIEDFSSFKERVKELKKQGVLIAIDDVGKGNSNFQSIIELEPDFLKLDRYFASQIEFSPEKQSIIRFFLNYSNQYGSQLIVEGLETDREVEVVKSLGVSYAQGYKLTKPTLLSELTKSYGVCGD